MLELPNEIVKCKPCYPHILFIGKQRTCKDIIIVKEIYTLTREHKSLFDIWLQKEYLDGYERNIKNVYANCWLDERYFPEGVHYEFIDDLEQFEDLRDGILYLHDLEMIFNSRGRLSDKDMIRLLEVVNAAGKHRLQIRGSCHRNMSVDVKLRSLINLWVEPKPYHSDETLNSYNVALSIYDSYKEKIGFDVIDELHRVATLYNTEEESSKIKHKVLNGESPLGQKPILQQQTKVRSRILTDMSKDDVLGG